MEESQILRSQELENAPIGLLIIKMAIPAIIGLMVSAIYNLVDTIFISNLGKSQSAAATISFPIFLIISAIGLAIGIGAQSSISRLMGQKNIKKSEKVVATTTITSFFISIIVTCILYFNIESILRLFGATDTNMIYSKEYTAILALGSIFTILNMTLNNMLRAEGSSTMSMYALITGAVLNIILDPIFMFSWGLNLQMKGAAIATILSQMCSTILLFYFYLSKKTILKMNFKLFTPTTEIYKEIIAIGFPTLCIQLLMSLSLTVFTNTAKPYGDAAISSIGISMRVIQLGEMVIIGFSQGYQPVAGFNFGARKMKRVKEALHFALKWSSIFATLYTITIFIFANPIVSLFNKDPEIMHYGVIALRIFYLAFPICGYIMIYNYTFQSLGMPKETMILSITRQGFFLIPLIIIFEKIFGFTGILISKPIAEVLTAILTYIYAIKLDKKILKQKY